MEEAWNKLRGQEAAKANEIADLFRHGRDAINNFYPQNLPLRYVSCGLLSAPSSLP